MQRQEIKMLVAVSMLAQENTNLIERNFSPGDFRLRELFDEPKSIPPREKESLLWEELFIPD